MKRWLPALALLPAVLIQPAVAGAAPAARQVEKLDRRVVAIPAGSGIFIGWRLLATDAPGTAFNLYRDGRRLNAAPLSMTNLLDADGKPGAAYTVRPLAGGKELAASPAEVLSALRPGDAVLMQFGHNDRKQIREGKGGPFTTYLEEIRQHVTAIRARGVCRAGQSEPHQ